MLICSFIHTCAPHKHFFLAGILSIEQTVQSNKISNYSVTYRGFGEAHSPLGMEVCDRLSVMRDRVRHKQSFVYPALSHMEGGMAGQKMGRLTNTPSKQKKEDDRSSAYGERPIVFAGICRQPQAATGSIAAPMGDDARLGSRTAC